MKNYLKLLLAALALLCTPSASAQYEDWTSTNTTTWSSSSHTWTVEMQEAQWLYFDYYKTNNDGNFCITIDGYSFNSSNTDRETFRWQATSTGTITIEASFRVYSDNTIKAFIKNMHVTSTEEPIEINGTASFSNIVGYYVKDFSSYSSNWLSADTHIARVSSGKVYGLALGSTTVTATIKGQNRNTGTYETISTTIPVKVTNVGINLNGRADVSGIFDISTLISENTGIVAIAKHDVYKERARTYHNANGYGYSVDYLLHSGYIYGLSEGTTTISNNEVNIPVTVKTPYSWNTSSGMLEGLPDAFKSFTQKDAVSWDSADENIAIVIDGIVVGLQQGTTTITGTARDGQSIAFTVNVDRGCSIADRITDSYYYSNVEWYGYIRNDDSWNSYSCSRPNNRK